jgi:DNA-binding LacI/PurR family transcriptional regulator
LAQIKRPTIRDVAAAAGVSKSLVSLVFSSEDGVSPERRDRVLAAAKKLGFTPNPWARSLATGSGDFMAIVVVDLHNPLFTEIADEARKELLERGHQTFMTAASITEVNGKKVLEKSTVQTLLDLKPRGILVVGDLPDKNTLKSVPDTVPIIFATTIPKGLPRAIVLRIDEDEGMRLIVNHLVSLGHKRICYIGADDGEVASARIGGFRKAMAAKNLNSLEQFGDRTEAAGYAAAKLALQGKLKPTALVCFNDIVALGAQEAIEAFEASGGHQVALTGFDNTYISALNRISITSVEQEKKAIAMKAAEILSDEELWKKSAGKDVLLLPKLEVRNSTTSVKL